MKAPKCSCYGDDRCEAHLPETADKLAEALNALVEDHDHEAKQYNFKRCGCKFCQQARAVLIAAGWEEE